MVLVLLGAMVGAPARYLLDRAVQRRNRSPFPWGTFAVNVLGSAILGALTGAAVSTNWHDLAGVGFCGAFTTFSTFGYETVRLAEDGAYLYATANVVVSVLSGLAAATAAFALTQWAFA
ncbi:MAG TPA: fluoride efflux transporter CrcB [Aldersonia sp.]